MGYASIPNLYRPEAKNIFLFKRVWSLEKIEGTSVSISYNPLENNLKFFSGGTNYNNFVSIFKPELIDKFKALSVDKPISVFGEGYGSKIQGMSHTYGKELKFIAFDVRIGESWLNIDSAAELVKKLDLEFVHFVETSTDLSELDEQRDADSVQAIRNGIGAGKMREGIVIRPIVEMSLNNGERICAKHKRKEFCETRTPREIDAKNIEIFNDAEKAANEWVTENRVLNVLSHFGETEVSITNMSNLIGAVVNDVYKESDGEVKDDKVTKKFLSQKAVVLLKEKLTKIKQ